MKIIGDKIVAATVSGEICIRDKNNLDKGYTVKHGETIKGLDIYKDMLVSACKQITIWKFG